MKIASILNNLKGEVFYPKNSLGIKRKDMPQIEDDKQGEFLDYLKELGLKYSKSKVSVSSIKPAQNELSYKAAQALLDSKSPKLNKPLVISQDNYIVDGHHRWLAHLIKDENAKVESIQISEKAKKLINIVKNFSGVKFKSIDNKVTEKLQKQDLDRLESALDRLFKSLNIDIEFTKHFLDRVNDARNGEDITTSELAELFGATYQKYGKKLAKLDKNTEAVLNDIRSDINVPFVINFNEKTGMLELVSKTVMRKKAFKTSNTIYKVGEKMKLSKLILNAIGKIEEKLILLNKNKKNGQVLFLAGGSASGKGFTVDRFIDSSSYKVFDVDAMKKLIITIAKKTGNKELANLDLKNPDDVFKLHQYVDSRGLADKQFTAFVNQIKKDRGLPNVLFDVTLKNVKKVKEKTEPLFDVGYTKDNVHLVWVLADYTVALEQNQKRDRTVPEDIVFETHSGAAKTMADIIKGNVPEEIDGEIYVIFSDARLSVNREASDFAKTDKKGKKYTNLKDFLYVKIKEVGKPIKSEKEIKEQVYFLAKEMVPSEVKGLFQ
jgi:hypothetical protein